MENFEAACKVCGGPHPTGACGEAQVETPVQPEAGGQEAKDLRLWESELKQKEEKLEELTKKRDSTSPGVMRDIRSKEVEAMEKVVAEFREKVEGISKKEDQ